MSMFRIQALQPLLVEAAEFQIADQLSFSGFWGGPLDGPVTDAASMSRDAPKWLFCSLLLRGKRGHNFFARVGTVLAYGEDLAIPHRG